MDELSAIKQTKQLGRSKKGGRESLSEKKIKVEIKQRMKAKDCFYVRIMWRLFDFRLQPDLERWWKKTRTRNARKRFTFVFFFLVAFAKRWNSTAKKCSVCKQTKSNKCEVKVLTTAFLLLLLLPAGWNRFFFVNEKTIGQVNARVGMGGKDNKTYSQPLLLLISFVAGWRNKLTRLVANTQKGKHAEEAKRGGERVEEWRK